MYNKKLKILLIILISTLLCSCSSQQNTKHENITTEENIVTFNYKLYEMPMPNQWGHFEMTIYLVDNKFSGSNAKIKFKSTKEIEVDEKPIDFLFENKYENLRISVFPKDLSKPINLTYEGVISGPNGEIPINGSLLINRKTPY